MLAAVEAVNRSAMQIDMLETVKTVGRSGSVGDCKVGCRALHPFNQNQRRSLNLDFNCIDRMIDLEACMLIKQSMCMRLDA